MNSKKKVILIVAIIAVVISAILTIMLYLKNKKNINNNGANHNFDSHLQNISDILKKDNVIKQLFYSNPEVTEGQMIFENQTYYVLSDKYNIENISEIYDILGEIYSVFYQEDLYNDINNYNSFIIYEDKLYINIKKKCYISDYDESLLSIKNVDSDIITYTYDNKDYEISFLDDKYYINSTPFEC